jgi:cobalt-zinc-cadmium efflux system outer membrane protein
MKRLLAGTALVFVAAGGLLLAQQAASPPLTLGSALDRALVTNPVIAAARLRRPVDLAGVNVARERLNPDVTFEAAKDAPKEGVGASFPIELGGKRQKRIGLAQAGVSAGEAEIDRVIAEVQNDVRRAYFEAVAADRLVALAQDSRQLAVRARDAARARFNAGDVAQSDVAQTELTLASADDDVLSAKGEAAAARADLNTVIGQPATTPLTLADDLTAAGVLELDAALSLAARSNTEIVALDRRIAEQAARRDLAGALRTPDLTAGAGVTFNGQPDFAVGWKMNVGLTVPLFTTHRAGVELEAAELARLRAEREAFGARVIGAVTAALARVAAARERVAHFQSTTLPLVESVERFAQTAYAAGQQPLAALLQALQQTRETRRTGLGMALAYQLALADLERAIGTSIR